MTHQTKKSLRLKLNLTRLAIAALFVSSLGAAQAQTAVPMPPVPTLDVNRYIIDGDALLSADEVQRVLAPFTGPKRSLTDIENAARALEKAIRDKGYAFHRTFVPVQKPANGEVKLQIIAFTLGKVEVTGNEHFSTANIRRGLQGLKEGEPPQIEMLGRDVSASNANPAKQVAVTFKESQDVSKVDAVVKVKDTPPLSFYGTVTGNQYVSGAGNENNVWRATAVAQHANLFDRDHVMTLSYTTDMRQPRDVNLWGAFYQIPLYGMGATVSAFYTKSDINSGTVQQGAGIFNVSGSGRFAGVRYTQALPRFDTHQHTVAASLEDRKFSNSTTFNGVQITPDVNSRVIGLHYAMRNDRSWGEVLGTVDYLFNTPGGNNNDQFAHAASGGTRNWNALRFSAQATATLGAWNVNARLRGQHSDKALINGEQFGLGGTSSVRGFTDRVIAGERGVNWGVETTGPELFGTPFKPALFIEGGTVRSRVTGQSDSIASVGAGLRFARERVMLSLDLAQVVERAATQTGSQPVRMHFSATVRF